MYYDHRPGQEYGAHRLDPAYDDHYYSCRVAFGVLMQKPDWPQAEGDSGGVHDVAARVLAEDHHTHYHCCRSVLVAVFVEDDNQGRLHSNPTFS